MTQPAVEIRSAAAADTLAGLARDAGWDVTATADEARSLVVVDARGGISPNAHLPAGAPALVLVDAVTDVVQDRWYDAGAVQVAAVGADGRGFVQALRFLARALGGRLERRSAAGSGDVRQHRWLAARLAQRRPVTVIHVALLRLDLVNAAHGRSLGTALVEAAERRIAAQVAAVVEDDGLVVRIDGAAFLAAVEAPPEMAVVTAARIEEALARPFRLGSRSAVIGARLMLAAARPGEDAAKLIARAIAAQPALGVGGADPLAVDVHLALARDEVALLFQPQATIAGNVIVGVEALVRWHHPGRGALGAGVLLAAADEAGIGVALSEHIQRRVLDQVAAWPAALGGLRVSLNLTAADLARPGYAETLLAHVDASGVARERLTLEITETELMTDLDAAAAVLRRLQEAGCRIAIDDFGTGYSSLAYLAALPLDYLKLDRALAQEVGGSKRQQVVVRGAIDMARSLGLTVIAEGVESDAQRERLAEAGCALYQGFLLAEPLDEAALAALVEERG